jgi:ABC-type multidrug transport system ATPase subunit
VSILSIQNISKQYGHIQALKNVSFDIAPGCVFGILGPNGSGKTTMLGIVMDVIKASGGNYQWFNENGNQNHRKQIGTLLETPNFYHYLSGEKNLQITAAIKQLNANNINIVLEKVKLSQRKTSKFSTYSLGMKQRLAIAAALLGNPDVLVLDEPTNGLDPVGIAETRDLIKQLARDGKTIILASHLLDEVEKVCTHVAILQKGTLITTGHVDEVLVNEDIVVVAATDNNTLFTVLQQYSGLINIEQTGEQVQLFFKPGAANLAAVNQFCFEHGIILQHLQLKKKSLETKFFELTNTAEAYN